MPFDHNRARGRTTLFPGGFFLWVRKKIKASLLIKCPVNPTFKQNNLELKESQVLVQENFEANAKGKTD